MRHSLAGLTLLLACSGSAGDTPVAASLPAGVFNYTARNAAGQPLLVGQLVLGESGDSGITGSWSIAWAPGADTTSEVGPQVGAGDLTGYRSGSDIVLELNPGWADNNVGLVGSARLTGFSGRWEWTAFTGPRAGGVFEAVRNDSILTTQAAPAGRP